MKLTVCLCVFLAVIHSTPPPVKAANFFEQPLEAIKNAIDQTIIQAMDVLKKQLGETQKSIDKFINDGRAMSESSTDGMLNYLNNLLDNVQKEIDRLKELRLKSRLDVTECEQIARKLQRTLLSLAADATRCTNERVRVINRTVEPLQRESKEILQNLANIMTEAANCVKNREGNFWSNLSCLAEKKIRAIWDLTRGVPSLSLRLAEFTGSALFSPIPTGYCLTRQSFDTSVEQSQSILRSITQCAADRAEQLRTANKLPINGSTVAATAATTPPATTART